MKKKTWGLFLLILLVMPLNACMASAEKDKVNIAVIKGPTGMGAAHLMSVNEEGKAKNDYAFTIAGAPDVLVAQLITGELDMAALPTNTIALLYQRTEGKIQALAVNTLGVLYILERGDSVNTVEDLKGRTIVSAGRASTAEAVAAYLLGDDVTIDYVTEHAEAVAKAIAGEYDLVLLPEPFVTSLLNQTDAFRVAVNMTEAWEESAGALLPMGGIAVRKAFAAEHPAAVRAFLDEYAESVRFANENAGDAAAIIEAYDIMKAAVAESAIPRANMVCLTGDEMKDALTGFYGVLLVSNAGLIGDAMPGDDFYYAP